MRSLKLQENSTPELITRSLHAILKNLTEAVTVTDTQGRVIMRNKAAREMLLLRPGEETRPDYQVRLRYMDGTPVPQGQDPVARILRGEEVKRLEFLAERNDGSVRVFQFSGSLIREDGKPALVVLTYRDVTDMHRYAEQQKDYLRATSHDLRNPLSVLLTQAQLLEKETRLKGLHDENRAAQAILKSGKRISAMLDHLVESLSYDAGLWSLRPREIDVKRLVSDVIDRYRSWPCVKEISLCLPEDDVRAVVDADRVERCLENLITNAIQYSPPETRVEVSLAVDDETVHISVRDRGLGIDSTHIPKIFDRFYRVEGSGAKGLGLGLYIVRHIAEAHGGKVLVNSEPGQGSTFTLVLPINAAESSARDQSEEPSTPAASDNGSDHSTLSGLSREAGG